LRGSSSVSCGSVSRSCICLLDAFTGLPLPEFGSKAFLDLNTFEESIYGANSTGSLSVSDHFAAVGGKSSAATFVTAGVNKNRRRQTVPFDGTTTDPILPGVNE
jgi:hypothetical protein